MRRCLLQPNINLKSEERNSETENSNLRGYKGRRNQNLVGKFTVGLVRRVVLVILGLNDLLEMLEAPSTRLALWVLLG